MSVILPAYNGAEYISRAIESVLNQSCRDFELIVVDDGSTDQTRELLVPYVQAGAIQYVYQTNAGHGAARNRGIELARGKYICFVDQDDWLEPDSLQTRLSFYELHPDLGFVFSDFRLAFAADDKSKFSYAASTLKQYSCIERIPSHCVKQREHGALVFNTQVFPELIMDCFAWIGTVMIPKEIFARVGRFPEQFKWSPDHQLLVNISRQYDIAYIDKSTAVYRQHAENMSLNRVKLYDEAIAIRQYFLQPAFGLDAEHQRRLKASIGDYCYRRGRLLIGTRNHLRGARDIWSALRHDPLRFEYYKWLLIASMPMKLYFALKLGRQQAKQILSAGRTAALVLLMLFALKTSAGEWNIVWNDEFTGSKLDTNKWAYDIGNDDIWGDPGWGNNELEYYTDDTNNVFVADGLLHLKAIQQGTNGFNYTSGRIKTFGKASWKYGRFEVRAKLPGGIGFWPAIWFMPEDSTIYGGGAPEGGGHADDWPNAGEIDMTENNGTPNFVKGSLFFGGQNGYAASSEAAWYGFGAGQSTTEFHIYSLEWLSNSFSWFVDGNLCGQETNWWSNILDSGSRYPYPAPFDVPFYLIINLAIGGNYLGNPSTNQINASLPGEIQVDYVRVYDKTEPLALKISQSSGAVQLTWPSNIVCHLQVRSDLSSSGSLNWSDVAGASNPFVVSPTNGNAFFRLVSP